MTRPCRELEEWLGQSRTALSEGQRLALAQHLAECADCRALHAMSRAVGAAVRAVPAELAEGARARALAGAFARAAEPERRPRRWPVRVLAVVAAAALVLMAYATLKRPEQAWVEVQGMHHFAHARVTLLEGARVRFDATSSVLVLARGALEVEVDPAPRRPFAVETARFRAEVLGTSFRVDASRVIVHHGHVRVRHGATQLADLHSGERFDAAFPERARPAPEPPPKEAPAAQPMLPDAGPPPATAVSKRKRTAERRGLEPAAPAPHEASASALLAEARAALARDALEDTRRLLREAEAKAHAKQDQAEAGTLRAELALRERDQSAAVRAYLQVATRFPELASGENALFAAAQLSGPAAAQPLLRRYLEQYPQGRFAAQVRTRLRAATH